MAKGYVQKHGIDFDETFCSFFFCQSPASVWSTERFADSSNGCGNGIPEWKKFICLMGMPYPGKSI